MQPKRLLKSIHFYLITLAVLLVDFFCCWVVASIKFKNSGITILPLDVTTYKLSMTLGVFSRWGLIGFIGYVIFYFSIYFAFLDRKSRIKVGPMPLIVSIILLILFFQLKEVALPHYSIKSSQALFNYQYALFFYNNGFDAYYSAKEFEQIDKQKALFYYKKSQSQFSRYVSYDKNCTLDKSASLFPTKKEASDSRYLQIILREIENSVKILMLNSEVLQSGEKMTPMLKFRLLDEANNYLDRGRKEQNFEFLVKAYEVFFRCYNLSSSDFEFIDGMKISKNDVLANSFFRSDINELFAKPYVENILIVEKTTSESKEPITVVFEAAKAITSQGCYFFEDVSIQNKNSETGKTISIIKAKYAKLFRGQLIFSSLNDDIKADQIEYATLVCDGEPSNLSQTKFYGNANLLPYLKSDGIETSRMSIFDIIGLLAAYGEDDPRELLLWIEILFRIFCYAFIFSFPLISILLSTNLKPKSKRAPWWMVVFAPLLLGLIYLFYQIFFYLAQVFVRFILLSFSALNALICVSATSFTVVLIVLIIYLVRIRKGKI